MRKRNLITIAMMLLVMFSYAQMNNNHLLTDDMLKPFQTNKQIDTSNHVLLTAEMLKPFQSIKEYQSIILLKYNMKKEIKLYLKNTKYINYYFVNKYYNTIRYEK